MAYIQDCWPTRTSQQVLTLIIAYNFVLIMVERQHSERIFHIKIIFYYLPVLKKISSGAEEPIKVTIDKLN